MTTDDDKITRRYRELAREAPPSPLAEPNLAAAPRAADARPAPLVVPSGRRRWYFPLAAAAVIVLAVAVTVHVERQQRDTEAAEAPAPQELRAQRKTEVLADAQKPQAAAPAAPAPAAEPMAAMRSRAEATAGAASRFAAAAPEQWLQAIDDLKRQGQHDEAEKELAEFRKRYPDYHIPEAIAEKFERR